MNLKGTTRGSWRKTFRQRTPDCTEKASKPFYWTQATRNTHTDDEAELANRLNNFYTRFDKHDFKPEQERVMQKVHRRSFRPVTVEEKEVATCLRQVKPESAAGPDNISSKTLRECADSLAPVFTRLFQWSLDGGHVPCIWKTSNISVAKKRFPREMNDFRLVALTSVRFKCAE